MRWLSATVLSVVLVGTVQGAFGQQTELARARELIREGSAEEAWRLLSPLEAQYAGQADFDFQLAVAALESGRANRATFVLERVVVVQPGNVAARLELARAYFALRDFERAAREFGFVLQSDPPPDIRALVSQYQERMRTQLPTGELPARWSGYAQVVVGHDTNPGAATAQDSIFAPGLGATLLLEPPFLRNADQFSSLAGSVQYAVPLSGSFAILAGAEGRLRAYDDMEAFDAIDVDLHVGLRQRLDARHSIQYGVRHNDFQLDHAGYRRMQTASVEWGRVVSARSRVGISAQGYRIRYRQDEARASSSDLLAFGLSAAYALDASGRTVATLGVFLGEDNAVAGRADGDRRLHGASGGLRRRLMNDLEGYASIGWFRSDYREHNPAFGVTRVDRQMEMALGLAWGVGHGWSIQPQLARTRNRSNIELNDYGRTEASVTVRRDWD